MWSRKRRFKTKSLKGKKKKYASKPGSNVSTVVDPRTGEPAFSRSFSALKTEEITAAEQEKLNEEEDFETTTLDDYTASIVIREMLREQGGLLRATV